MGSQQGSPLGCFCFGASSRSTVIYLYISIELAFVNGLLSRVCEVSSKMSGEVPEVLFVCVHNAGRSQMAAGLLNKLADGKVHVRTAGSDPAEEINPAAVAAMAEVGVDLSQEFPKP